MTPVETLVVFSNLVAALALILLTVWAEMPRAPAAPTRLVVAPKPQVTEETVWNVEPFFDRSVPAS